MAKKAVQGTQKGKQAREMMTTTDQPEAIWVKREMVFYTYLWTNSICGASPSGHNDLNAALWLYVVRFGNNF